MEQYAFQINKDGILQEKLHPLLKRTVNLKEICLKKGNFAYTKPCADPSCGVRARGCSILPNRQVDGESSAASGPAVDLDTAPVGFDDTLTDGQAETETTTLSCREKRLENLVEVLGIDAEAGVRHTDRQGVGVFQLDRDG